MVFYGAAPRKKRMKAYVCEKPGVIRVEERESPKPGRGEVLLRVKCVGVCGSDVHWFKHGEISGKVMRKPTVLGHEFSAVVEALGEGVENLEIGQKVVAEPGVPCGKCQMCFKGLYNLCTDMQFCGTPPTDGVFQEFYISPSRFVFPFQKMEFEEAALVEPVAIAIHTLNMCQMRPGLSVTVFGCGAVGLMAIQAAKALGASTVLGVDIQDSRLELARKLGADAVVNTRHGPVTALADIVIESTGAGPVPNLCLKAAAMGGKVGILGIPAVDTITIDPHTPRRRELTMIFVRRYRHCFPAAVNLCEQGRIQLAPLVTHVFEVQRLQEALEFVADHPDQVVRAVIRVSA